VIRRQGWLQISEVYHDDNGKPTHYTERAVGVEGEGMSELENTLHWMQKALTLPILDDDDFGTTPQTED